MKGRALITPSTKSLQFRCQARGGTFTHEQGQLTRTYATTNHIGNSPHSQTTTTTEESDGSPNDTAHR